MRTPTPFTANSLRRSGRSPHRKCSDAILAAMAKKRMTTGEAFTALDQKLDRVITHMDKKFRQVDERFDKVEETLTKHTGYHAEHAATLKRLDEERLANVHRV